MERVIGNRQPFYGRVKERLAEEFPKELRCGCTIRFDIRTSDGTVCNAFISESSGSRSKDKKVLEWFEKNLRIDPTGPYNVETHHFCMYI